MPDQNCHQERVCRPVPGEQRCEEAEECGTNARGERICKTRKVCHDGPSREDCDYVQRCENTSRQECSQEKHCVETTRQECGYENVCYSVPVTRTRTVTRYRQEQRTRTVTKYYQVEKTREVTRYRDETRCCVTKYRDVFDHQDTLNVTIQFPQDAILYDGETEKMVISWIEKDNQIDVGLKMLTTFTSYKVVDRSVQGADAVLKLETVPVPALDPRLVGDQTVTGLRLKIMEDNTGVVVFKDVGQLAKISTVYELVVKDNTGLVLTTQRVTANGIADQKITLNQKLSLERDHTLTLKVLRSGAGLRPPIAFLKTFFRPH
ncbi:MAG: hypothetical protein COT73_07155 [Bdellovibrio sp. CG10_big_fil_rev_8_21_14_0_10_47_8]|nr:MAG: hypothetical protein COT73_07155 [Bdellovibrio sp. CG10_big_fil_rev_8_21_14_0_10_47_8]